MLRPAAAAVLALASVALHAQPSAPDGPGQAPPLFRSGGDGEATDLAAVWTGAPRWLTGAAFTSEAFVGGLDRGRVFPFATSTIGPEGDVPVEIRFDSTETTLAGRFLCCSGEPNELPAVFRGSAWDLSEPAAPRRLNVVLAENDGFAPPNGLWDPSADPFGNNEFLYVMASSYDGTGLTYAGAEDSDPLDVLYVLSARTTGGHPLYAASPATLRAAPAAVRAFRADPANGAVTLSWTYDRPEGAALRVWRRTDGVETETLAATLPVAARTWAEGGLSPDSVYAYRLDVVDAAGAAVHVSTQAFVRPLVSRGMSLVGRLDPRPPTLYYADLWGYVAPDGSEYALLTSSGNGLSVVALPESGPPVEVGFVPTHPDAYDSKDVEVFGRFAYLVNEIGPVQIIDLADPANPVEVGLLDTQPGVPDGGTHSLSVADGRLYVQGGRTPGGVRIYSLADPAAPALLGVHEPGYVHDVLVRGDTLYAARIFGGEGVDIVDVSDPTAPALISTFNYPGSGAHNVCATASGAHVFVGDEIGTGRWTRVFDVRDPDNVELVAEIVVDPAAIAHNCTVRGERLFVAHYTEGVRVYDIADPTAPAEVAFYDTFASPEYGFKGVWTVYPDLPSGRLIASDLQTGLWVFRLDETVRAEPTAAGPAGLALRVAPNPARDRAAVRLTLAQAADVRLTVHDALGRVVAVVADGPRAAGAHELWLDTSGWAAGVYVVRAAGGGEPAAQTLTVVR